MPQHPDVLLGAVVTQLTTAMPFYCTAVNTYLALDPWERPVSNPGSPGDTSGHTVGAVPYVFGVGPMGGSFELGNQIGGGQSDVRTTSGVMVVIHSPVRLDQVERDSIFLTDSTNGILPVATLVMKALVGFTPSDGAGGYLVADAFMAASWDIRREDGDGSLGSIGIGFRTCFDWDMS